MIWLLACVTGGGIALLCLLRIARWRQRLLRHAWEDHLAALSPAAHEALIARWADEMAATTRIQDVEHLHHVLRQTARTIVVHGMVGYGGLSLAITLIVGGGHWLMEESPEFAAMHDALPQHPIAAPPHASAGHFPATCRPGDIYLDVEGTSAPDSLYRCLAGQWQFVGMQRDPANACTPGSVQRRGARPPSIIIHYCQDIDYDHWPQKLTHGHWDIMSHPSAEILSRLPQTRPEPPDLSP